MVRQGRPCTSRNRGQATRAGRRSEPPDRRHRRRTPRERDHDADDDTDGVRMSGTLKFRDEYGQWQEFRAARGRVGPPGPPGPPGTGVEIQGVVQTDADLPASGDTGHAWLVVEPHEHYYASVPDRPIRLGGDPVA